MPGQYIPLPDVAVELLRTHFLNRTDRLCHIAGWGSPCPLDPGDTDNLERLLRAHLGYGDAVFHAVWKDREGRHQRRECRGAPRLGGYGVAPDGTTVFGMLDCDGSGHKHPLADPLGAAMLILDAIGDLGLPAYLESSKSLQGWHPWVFFSEGVEAAKVRRLLHTIVPRGILLADGGEADSRKGQGVEVFPKQDRIDPDGYGNQVWLPWYHGAAEGGNIFYRSEDGRPVPWVPDPFETVSPAALEAALAEIDQRENRDLDRFGPSYSPFRLRARGSASGKPSPETMLRWAACRLTSRHRNDTGTALAQQLRDNAYSEAEALEVMLAFQQRVEAAGDHPYTEREARASLKSAYGRPPREPWSHQSQPRNGQANGNGAVRGFGGATVADHVAPADYVPFPTQHLPPVVAAFVRGAAESIGCDESFVALPALASLAAVIGRTRSVRIKADWFEPCVLWCLPIAESGEKKTPPFRAAMAPLVELQQDVEDAADKEFERLQAEYEERFARGEKGLEKPERPHARRFYTNDATIEAVADLLEQNPYGLLVARDELSAWVDSMCRYTRGDDRARWLELHAAGELRVDRRTGDKRTIRIPHASACVCGTIQPGILAEVFNKTAVKAGFAARWLMAMPPRRKRQWTEAVIPHEAKANYAALVKKLSELTFELNDKGRRVPSAVHLTPEAKELWVAFYNAWSERQHQAVGPLASALSKLEGAAARLALFHHVAGRAIEGRDREPIGPESMQAGIALARWFADETARIYRVLDETEDQELTRKLAEWLSRRPEGATARDLQHSGFGGAGSAARAEALFQSLVTAGMAEAVPRGPGEKGGRPTKVYRLKQAPTQSP